MEIAKVWSDFMPLFVFFQSYSLLKKNRSKKREPDFNSSDLKPSVAATVIIGARVEHKFSFHPFIMCLFLFLFFLSVIRPPQILLCLLCLKFPSVVVRLLPQIQQVP